MQVKQSHGRGPNVGTLGCRTLIVKALILVAFGLQAAVAVDADAGTVSVSGSLVDSDGRAVVDGIVYLRHGPEPDYAYRWKRLNGDGRFQFDELNPGVIIVAAFADGFSVGGQTRVMLQPGKNATNVDLALSKSETLTVAVVDSAGKPVAGAKLSQLMWDANGAVPVWLPEPFLRRLKFNLPVSNERGELLIPWVPAGAACSVRVSHPDFAIGETPKSIVDKEPISLVLHRGTPVTIRVIDSSTGRPATDAVVSVLDATLSPFEQTDQQVDEHGEFKMRIAMAEQRVAVHVTHPTLAEARAYFFWKNEPATIEIPLYRTAAVSGRVVDPDGLPVENVRLSFSVPSNTSSFSSSAVTNGDGHFRLQAREGDGTVKVGNGRGFVYEGMPIQLHLEAGRTANVEGVVVSKIPPICGVAVNPDETPIPYALISDQSLPYGGQYVLADESGRFELPLLNLPRLATHVVVRHPSRQLSGGIFIPYAEVRKAKEFRVTVQPESTLIGHIEVPEADKNAVAGVRVSVEILVDMGKRKYMLPVASQVTDSSGSFRFSGLSRHTKYFINVTDKLSRGVPDELIELQKDVVELPVPFKVDSPQIAREESPPDRRPPPLGCAAWLNSAPLTLDRLKGRVVLIDFWATWCGPCLAELPKLELAHRLYADKGLVLIGVHDNSVSEADVHKFIQQRKISFPIALDNSKGDTVGRYNVTRWPTKVLIDRQGNLIEIRDQDDLFAVLRTMLLYD